VQWVVTLFIVPLITTAIEWVRWFKQRSADWHWLIDHDWHPLPTNAADGWTDDVGGPSRLVSLTAE
jgi:hypothetical protein